MAIPTITSVSPTTVFTGGNFLTIQGTNFRTAYTPPSANGPLPTPPPTMLVSVGGTAALRVRVYSATKLTCRVPPIDPGTYDVTVRNLDVNGAPITGETVTATASVVAQRADLSKTADLTRLERTLISELRRQVLENVLKTASVDYDGTPGGVFDVPDVSALPQLTIQGPQVVDDRFYDTDLSLVTQDGSDFTRRKTFKTVDLTYRFVVMTNHQGQNMNLFALMLQFIQNNLFLNMQRDPDDASKGVLAYELSQVGELTTFTGSSNSDIRGFSGSFVIRGVSLEDVVGFVDQAVAERGRTVDNVVVDTQGFLPP